MKDEIDDCVNRRKNDRLHCEMVVALSSRMSDFIDRYNREDQERKEWRQDLGRKLDAINDTIRELKVPYRVGLWIGVCMVGAMLIQFVRLLFVWLGSHIK